MPKRHLLLALLLLTGLVFLPRPSQASEGGTQCTGTIASLPTVINTPGTWCLARDLTTMITEGFVVFIGSHDVTLDCNGHRLASRAMNPNAETWGIIAADRRNITVRNCRVDGFRFGILLQNGSGLEASNNRLSKNTYVGIFVVGDNSVIKNNVVFDTGGRDSAIGIEGVGDVDIIDNVVSGVKPAATSFDPNPSAIGIASLYENPTIAGNRVRGLVKVGEHGLVVGIDATGVDRANIHDNDLTASPDGRYGILCSDTRSVAVHNIINGFTTPVFGCAAPDNTTNP